MTSSSPDTLPSESDEDDAVVLESSSDSKNNQVGFAHQTHLSSSGYSFDFICLHIIPRPFHQHYNLSFNKPSSMSLGRPRGFLTGFSDCDVNGGRGFFLSRDAAGA